MTNLKTKPVKIGERVALSPAGRVSYPHVFEAWSGLPNAKPSYSVTLLFAKNDPGMAIFKEVNREAVLAKPEWKGRAPAGFRTPVRDADRDERILERNPEYAGHYVVKFQHKFTQPLAIDRNKAEILDAREIYGGCWARVKFEARPYEFAGNCGVTYSLQVVQKLADVEDDARFGGDGLPTADGIPDDVGGSYDGGGQGRRGHASPDQRRTQSQARSGSYDGGGYEGDYEDGGYDDQGQGQGDGGAFADWDDSPF